MNYQGMDDKDVFTTEARPIGELEESLAYCLQQAEVFRLKGNVPNMVQVYLDEAEDLRRRIAPFYADS